MRGNAGHELPVRPLIPVTAAFFAGLVVGSIPILNRGATAVLEGGELSGIAMLALVAAGLLLLLTSYLLSRRLHGRLVAALSLFGFGVIAGSLVSHLWYTARLGESQSYKSLSASAMTFVIDDDPSISDQGYSFSVSVSAGDVSLGKARLILDQDVSVGSRVRVIGRIKAFSSDDYGRSRVLHGELRRITAIRIVSVEPPGPSQPLALFRSTLLKVIDAESSPARALITGVVCGRATEREIGFLVREPRISLPFRAPISPWWVFWSIAFCSGSKFHGASAPYSWRVYVSSIRSLRVLRRQQSVPVAWCL